MRWTCAASSVQFEQPIVRILAFKVDHKCSMGLSSGL
ncbi:MAG: hypothetical protein ACJAZO_002815 [Myxococcota bacterium]|jgi:hypothetical protein